MTILAALLTSLGFPLSPRFTAAAEGSNIAPTDLARGRWALLFVVVLGCPAYEDAIRWLEQAHGAHPEVHPLLVGPWRTRELEATAF